MATNNISLEDKQRTLDKLNSIDENDHSKNNDANITEILHDILIVTRDKEHLEEVFTKEIVERLVQLAKLGKTEAQKCISNLVMNSSALRQIIIDPYCECVIHHSDTKVRGEVQYFDLRIVFLLSALSTDQERKRAIRDKLENSILSMVQDSACDAEEEQNLSEALKVLFNFSIVSNEHHAAIYFDLILELLSREIRRSPASQSDEEPQVSPKLESCPIPDSETDTSTKSRAEPESEENEPATEVAPKTDSSGEKDKVSSKYPVNVETYSHVVDLITEMDASIYKRFDTSVGNSMIQFIDLYLEKKPKQVDQRLIPIFRVLSLAAAKNRQLRKAWKDRIFPPETNFMQRPEVGESLRARIVRLLTFPDVQVKNSAALFLFVLCKQNVNRFVKYTGYGNAAGYLANLTSWNFRSEDCDFSSDDGSDSESEQYEDIKRNINPVTGAYEEPRPHPMDNMSEEEKEYHAVQLANAMSKMSKLGIIEPILKSKGDDK